MKFNYGSKIEFSGKQLTFIQIGNTKTDGVTCLFSDDKGKIIKLTQQDVEGALGL